MPIALVAVKPSQSTALIAVCRYYTMYPLDFPLNAMRRLSGKSNWVLDPFCGRGTTNYAARLVGAPSIGFDSSPIAIAITRAKLTAADASAVVREAEAILRAKTPEHTIPDGPFWRLLYHPDTLRELCHLRAALLDNCRSSARIVLRAILLGALHGPRTKGAPSYLSNQSPRTFAPKPDYAVRFWRRHRLRPPRAPLRDIVRRRAAHYLTCQPVTVASHIRLADSRDPGTFAFDQRVS